MKTLEIQPMLGRRITSFAMRGSNQLHFTWRTLVMMLLLTDSKANRSGMSIRDINNELSSKASKKNVELSYYSSVWSAIRALEEEGMVECASKGIYKPSESGRVFYRKIISQQVG